MLGTLLVLALLLWLTQTDAGVGVFVGALGWVQQTVTEFVTPFLMQLGGVVGASS